MIARIIQWSLHNRALVLIAAVVLAIAGLYSLRNTPVDALPDLSDVQVIVKTSYPGQAPQVVEDQVTYPLTTAMLSVPGAHTVRGYSFFGDSYVYVIFDDDVDLYWARSRVLEYLSQVAPRLPAAASPELGPDATGVGWIYSYTLVDPTGKHDLAQLRSLQDWFLKYELQTLPGVSEVATVGGMVRQYQVQVDPLRLRAYDLTLAQVQDAIERGNRESGASVVEMAEAEYMVRASGYIQSVEDLRQLPLLVNDSGTPLLLRDVADVHLGPQMRRGLSELNGEGEAVGGVIVMRFGENARAVIDRVRARLQELQRSLPAGVEIVPTYDRSELIDSAVDNLWHKLLQEFIVVALVCALFLFHLRSSLVIAISLPLGIIGAFVVMHLQGINANIMSLGGIAIAIGAMVDGAIVMIENLHKHMERTPLTEENRWKVVGEAASEVGPPLFFSLLIITLSFLPVFALEGQEGRLFAPLAYTKTYAMAVAAGLAITLVPVLMGYLVRGEVKPEQANPINRAFTAAYRPALELAIRYPLLVVVTALALLASALYPLSRTGSEFMPPLDEGDLMYMPSTHPGISIGKARELLQQTDKMIMQVPEVAQVWGKMGRAETATDPAPLTMVETIIRFKPRDQWRDGMTPEKLRAELDAAVQLPGVTNAWVMPIKTRIDMLATGIKTPVGIKIAGADLHRIEKIGTRLESLLKNVPGTASVFAERVEGGRYIDIDIDRSAAARYGLNIQDVQTVIDTAVGGKKVGETVEGLERYPINVRYPQAWRDSPENLRSLPLVAPNGTHLSLGDVATIAVESGPPMIKTENARPNGWIYIDIANRDLGSWVAEAQQLVASELALPPGYSLAWSGQYEYMERARERLGLLLPVTLGIIVLLLYFSFRHWGEVLVIMGTLPMALIGGLWLLYWLDFNLSVAVGVGFIALAGVAVEIGVIMLVYLNQAWKRALAECEAADRKPALDDLLDAIRRGAGQRMRPVLMTTATVFIGLVPVMIGSGVGSEVMQRIAAPMVGGMVSAMLLTLVVIPSVYRLWKGRGLASAS
ncbi:efflux RND transporter permease subunit [Microbulbifer hydrolyticus]|uniref:Cu(I)/Ag(I) efflux system membrane protein CusA/SilA n=1 Tax=Microbulbifer hydrolyticus TaxID=48074 RepID=A0A6P1TAA6_9GAMM|nr:efflux RND transporter permease subunit [Microbulbifer hydrolyticus]MBB5211699.1 Cu(I)/Ag(I) efflux system membrane protein CusA/SilA [Microbulbifer hydrolyticus]QHQ37572.1 CusA/CzcA family heavy metal efflux RND transporter [Microbulbifer hydrolyticus]